MNFKEFLQEASGSLSPKVSELKNKYYYSTIEYKSDKKTLFTMKLRVPENTTDIKRLHSDRVFWVNPEKFIEIAKQGEYKGRIYTSLDIKDSDTISKLESVFDDVVVRY